MGKDLSSQEDRINKFFYIATGWDGERYPELISALDKSNICDFYGSAAIFGKLVNYCGAPPFDGISILNRIKKYKGVLCIHKKEHANAQMPNMRIFEAAYGNCRIATNFPTHSLVNFGFNEEQIKENIAEIDPCNISQTLFQINEMLDLPPIKTQMDYTDNETLILKSVYPLIARINKSQNHIARSVEKKLAERNQKISVIVRSINRDEKFVKRALKSIQSQNISEKFIEFILVTVENSRISDDLKKKFSKVVIVKDILRSSTLWAGLKVSSGFFIANLDDDDIIYPAHIVENLSRIIDSDYALCYGGSVQVTENDSLEAISGTENRILKYFREYDLKSMYINSYITSNSWVLKREIIESIHDPFMNISEDFYLLLKLISMGHKFAFSATVTSEYRKRFIPDGSYNTDTRSSEQIHLHLLEIMTRVGHEKLAPSPERLIPFRATKTHSHEKNLIQNEESERALRWLIKKAIRRNRRLGKFKMWLSKVKNKLKGCYYTNLH